MSDELICARCHLPVDLRDALHMGKHVVHDASICVTLLQSRLDEETKRADGRSRGYVALVERLAAAEQKVVQLEDDAQRRETWLRDAKRAWGMADQVSFDIVWKEALGLRSRRDELIEERAELVAQRNQLVLRLDSLQNEHDSLKHDHERLFARDTANLNRLIECQGRLDQIRELIRRAPNGNLYVDRVWELVREPPAPSAPSEGEKLVQATKTLFRESPPIQDLIAAQNLCNCGAAEGERHSDGCNTLSRLVELGVIAKGSVEPA